MVRSAGARPRATPADELRPSRHRPAARSLTYRAAAPRRATDVEAGRTVVWVFVALALTVVAFTGAWASGELIFDGPGVGVFATFASDQLFDKGFVSFWVPQIWAGTPGWAVASVSTSLSLAPLVEWVGADRALQIATIVAQVVAAWGAYVLARSLWRDGAAAVLAGIFYALSPVLVSHAAIFGIEPSTAVMAATPWFVWSLRRSLRDGGARWVALSGLLAGFCVLQQQEYAFGVALFGVAIVANELFVGSRRTSFPEAAVRIGLRSAAIGALGLALAAHNLVPFLSLRQWFVLNPSEEIRHTLGPSGLGGLLGEAPESFLNRPGGLTGRVGFEVDFLTEGFFYLSIVLVALTFVTAFLLARRPQGSGTLGVIILASLFMVWTSTALTPLADGNIADAGPLPSLLVGVLAGLLVAGLLRQASALTTGVAVVSVVAIAIAIPYVAPFELMRDRVPLLEAMRFPRLYPFASLGLALGGAYPVRAFTLWYNRRTPAARTRPLVPLAVALAVLAAFLVDVWPTASFYRVDGRSTESYTSISPQLRREQASGRAATPAYPDSRLTAALVDDGWDLSTGWPHPVAGTQLWRLTAGSWSAPSWFRDRALGLASTTVEFLPEPDEALTARPVRNLFALPLARAYDEVLFVEDADLATDLAVDLAGQHVNVVTGRPPDGSLPDGITSLGFLAGDPCDRLSERRIDPAVVDAVGRACSRAPWLHRLPAPSPVRSARPIGAVFRAYADGLRAVDVAVDAATLQQPITLSVRPYDERTAELGPVLREVGVSGTADGTMARFSFDPLPSSRGKSYVFSLHCSRCEGVLPVAVFDYEAVDTPGNLVFRDRVDDDRVVVFALDYGEPPVASPAPAQLRWTRPEPGEWRVQVDGDHATRLVIADTYFPGWHAEVDGESVDVDIADGAFVGIEVPAGEHDVRFVYRAPSTVVLGYVVSALALVLVLVMLIVPRRFESWFRRRRAGRPAVSPPSSPPARGGHPNGSGEGERAAPSG
jgi:hypothetical protein